MADLILVSEPKAAKKLRNSGNKAVIVSLNDASSSSLSRQGIKFRRISDFISSKEAEGINSSSISWVREWSEKSRIKDITYRNISVWWFFDFWLYFSFFKWDMLKNMIWYVHSIKSVIKKAKPGKVTVHGNSIVAGIAKQVYPKVDIRLYNDFQHKKPYLIDHALRVKHSLRKIAARFYYRGKKPGRKDIVFAGYTSWFRPCVKEDGKTAKEDAILGYVIRAAMKKHRVMLADIDFTQTSGTKILKEKMETKENIPFEYYFTGKIDRHAKRKAREIRKQWKALDDGKFRKTLSYEGVDFYPAVKPWLDFVFRKRTYLMIKYIEAALEMLDCSDPKLVFIVDETAIFGRAVITAAKLKRLPVVALQHGYVIPGSFEYMHLKGEISNDLSIEKPYCPIADKTFVYGPYTYEVLTKQGNYPGHSVEVTGQPRYDCLANKKIFSREKVFRQFSLDKNKKLILWTTQMVPGQDTVVFNGVKNIKNAQLLVKLHPRELEGVEPYYKKAKEMGLRIKAVREGNTFEMINVCDVMITMHSTTGLEAIMMNKPIIVLNISGKPDMVPYVQEGAALGVYRPEDLEPAVKRILFDSKAREELMKNLKDYSYRHSYKMDGKATERVMKVVEELMKKSK